MQTEAEALLLGLVGYIPFLSCLFLCPTSGVQTALFQTILGLLSAIPSVPSEMVGLRHRDEPSEFLPHAETLSAGRLRRKYITINDLERGVQRAIGPTRRSFTLLPKSEAH